MNLTNYKHIIDDIEPGETVRINHTDCSAGEDTRRRLYLTRTMANPEVTVAYCHNCQEGSKTVDSGFTSYRSSRHGSLPSSAPTVVDQIVEPPGLVVDLSMWPIEARAWAIKNHLKNEDVQKYRIGHDPSTNRVYLPRYEKVTTNGVYDLIGYQLRKVDESNGPKYLTVAKDGTPSFSVLHSRGVARNKCVIVEDLLSGIAVVNAHDDQDMAAIVIYGTKIDLEAMHHASHYAHTLVWLDNDSTHVVDQARQMLKTIKLMGGTGGYRCEGTDPKHETRDEIRKWCG